MRLAPVPMFYESDPVKAIEMSAKSSLTTHAARPCIDACRYFGALIVGALRGVNKETLLSDHYSPAENYWTQNPLSENIDIIASGSFKHKHPPAIRGSGFVVESLEAALWAFHNSTSFEEGCLLAVNLGDDADTTGAVFGQLAGAYYGKRGIPAHWLEKISMFDEIEKFAEELCRLSESNSVAG